MKHIAIIGSGLAGLAAAVSAAEKGVQVTVLEARKSIGGISVTGMGIFAVESRLQKAQNIDYTVDDVFKYVMQATQYKVDPALLRAYLEETAPTIDWFTDIGVNFELCTRITFPGSFYMAGHLVRSPKVGIGAGASSDLVYKVYDRALELGVEVKTKAPMRDIIRTEKGFRVLYGQSAETEQVLEADAVIIAAGGFTDDEKLMASVDNGYKLGENYANVHSLPLPGFGIRKAYELGAVSDGYALMMTTFCDGEKFPRSKKTQPLWDLMMFSFPYLWVNKQGKRFVNEGLMDGASMANAVSRQKDGAYYMIFDRNIAEHIKKFGPDIHGYLAEDLECDVEAMFNTVIESGAENYYRADTLEELAEMMDVPYVQLCKTVEKYNQDCYGHYDSQFCKNRRFLYPIDTPKYYAIRRKNAGYGTVGGIKIDEKMRAVNKDYEVIPGLYAVGDCANNIVNHNISLMYNLWGSCLGFAAVSGKIAGAAAADYIQNKKEE